MATNKWLELTQVLDSISDTPMGKVVEPKVSALATSVPNPLDITNAPTSPEYTAPPTDVAPAPEPQAAAPPRDIWDMPMPGQPVKPQITQADVDNRLYDLRQQNAIADGLTPKWAEGQAPVIPGYGQGQATGGAGGQRAIVNELSTVLTAPKLGTDDAKAQSIYDAMIAAHPERAADAAQSLEMANDAVLTSRTTRENPSQQRYGPEGQKALNDLLTDPDKVDTDALGRSLAAAKGLPPTAGRLLAGQYKRAAQEAANQQLVAQGDLRGPDAFQDWGQAFKYAQLKGQDFGSAYRFANEWRKQKYGADVASTMVRTAAPGPQETAQNRVRAVIAKMQGQGRGQGQPAPSKAEPSGTPTTSSPMRDIAKWKALEEGKAASANSAAATTRADTDRRSLALSYQKELAVTVKNLEARRSAQNPNEKDRAEAQAAYDELNGSVGGKGLKDPASVAAYTQRLAGVQGQGPSAKAPAAAAPKEGQMYTNPKTGAVIQYVNGKWVALSGGPK